MSGRLADRFGLKRMLSIILALWFVAMTWAALVPTGTVHLGNLAFPAKDLFYAVGPLAGLALGSTWACDRTFLLRVTAPAMIREVLVAVAEPPASGPLKRAPTRGKEAMLYWSSLGRTRAPDGQATEA